MAKYAVKTGGGNNHRMGLFDMVMIKDNHIDAAGSITKAVDKIRQKWGNKYKIEVECRTFDEINEAIENKVDIIMLDNMNPNKTVKACALKPDNIKFESSGNMKFDDIKNYRDLGIDYISFGCLTHSVITFDFSMIIKKD